MSVFLTPELEPVFGGTYWPDPSFGNATAGGGGGAGEGGMGFAQVVRRVADAWRAQEGRCRQGAREGVRALRRWVEEGVGGAAGVGAGGADEGGGVGVEMEVLEEAYGHFVRQFDAVNGGLGAAPKFPTPVKLGFLLRLGEWGKVVRDLVGEEECEVARGMAVGTLRRIARSGVRDLLGGGLARYSVTADWNLPRFEKMVGDQAGLLGVGLDAWVVGEREVEMLGVVLDLVAYLTRGPLVREGGGWGLSEDSESEVGRGGGGEMREGGFYVWEMREVERVLGERDAGVVARFYGLRADGNVRREDDPLDEFVGVNILRIVTTPGVLAKEMGMEEGEVVRVLKEGRRKLREWRERERKRPAVDGMVVVAYNGLVIGALARASVVLQEIDEEKAEMCRRSAEKAVEFIKKELFEEDTGRLWRFWWEGRGDVEGFADDYAFLIQGLIELYEATFEEVYLRFADRLQSMFIPGCSMGSPQKAVEISRANFLDRISNRKLPLA